MTYNYRVELKASPSSPWHFSGVIESNRELAHKVWAEIVKNLRYHDYRLVPIAYGVPIERQP